MLFFVTTMCYVALLKVTRLVNYVTFCRVVIRGSGHLSVFWLRPLELKLALSQL